MKVKEMITLIESKYDIHLAPEWDNSGLQVGSLNDDANHILVALEVTDEVIDEAITGGYNTIITHHPLLFNGVKSLNDADSHSRMTFRLIRNKITVYSLHTPLDFMNGGTSDFLCNAIGLIGITKLNPEFSNTPLSADSSSVRVGEFSEPIELEDFAKMLKKSLSLSSIRISASGHQIKRVERNHPSSLLSERLGSKQTEKFLDLSLGRKVQRVAVCAGAGMSLFDEVISNDIDAYITSDIKHHDYRRAESHKIILVDVGHFESENIFMHAFAKDLSRLFARSSVIVGESTIIENPFMTY